MTRKKFQPREDKSKNGAGKGISGGQKEAGGKKAVTSDE
jgi:hypothetical protein